jgi:hypothetical protein
MVLACTPEGIGHRKTRAPLPWAGPMWHMERAEVPKSLRPAVAARVLLGARHAAESIPRVDGLRRPDGGKRCGPVRVQRSDCERWLRGGGRGALRSGYGGFGVDEQRACSRNGGRKLPRYPARGGDLVRPGLAVRIRERPALHHRRVVRYVRWAPRLEHRPAKPVPLLRQPSRLPGGIRPRCRRRLPSRSRRLQILGGMVWMQHLLSEGPGGLRSLLPRRRVRSHDRVAMHRVAVAGSSLWPASVSRDAV